MPDSSNQGIAIGASRDLSIARVWASRPARLAGALALVLAVTVGAWIDLRGDFRSTEAQLAGTRARLDHVAAELRADGRAKQQALAGYELARQQLERRQAGRDLTYSQLLAVNRRLDLRSQDLWRVAHDLQQRTDRLSNLSFCAVGAARALNQASIDDTAGLARTLRAIEAPCAAAKAS
jgi:hypothetical protein